MFSLNFNFGIPTPNLGSMYIRMDRGEYSPGDTVSGTILLDLFTPFNHNQVWITVAGVEQTSLVETLPQNNDQANTNNRHGHNHERYRRHSDHNFFFNYKIPVHTFGGMFIPNGQYSFPFSFVLPPGLPSTFDYSFNVGQEPCYAKVSYELRASLENPSSRGSPSLSHTQVLSVNQGALLGGESTRKELNQHVKSCCCIDKGHAKIISYFEKAEYVPGETAYLVSEVDNTKSKAKINSIDGIFRQKLRLQARGFVYPLQIDLNKLSLPGIEPGQARLGEQALRLALHLVSNSKQQTFNTRTNTSTIQPTCRGKLIQNEYFIVNRLHMDACVCCGEHPNCTMQLNVRNPSINYSGWSAMPTNWNPKTFDLVPLQFSSNFAFDTNAFMGQPPNNPGMPAMAGSPGMPAMGGNQGMPPMGGNSGMPPMGGNSGMPPMGGSPGMPNNMQ